MKKLILAVATLGFAGAAFAGTPVKSEYFYQTETGKSQVTPYLSYASQKVEVTGFKQTTTGETLNVKYERGLNEMMSVGATLGYLTNTQAATGSTDVKNKGLKDITLFLKGNNSYVEGSSFHYGADMNVSLGKSEVNNDKFENNAMTGGIGLVPYAGYQWLTGKAVTGVKVFTGLDLTKRTVNTTTSGTATETKDTGNNFTGITAFYEMPYEAWTWNGSLTYENQNTKKTTAAGGGTTTHAGGNFMVLKVAPTYKASETATVLGELSYTNLLGGKYASTDSVTYNELALQVGGRFTF